MKQTESTHHRLARPKTHTRTAMRAKMVKRRCVTFDLRAKRINWIGQRHRRPRHPSGSRIADSGEKEKIENIEKIHCSCISTRQERGKVNEMACKRSYIRHKAFAAGISTRIPFRATFLSFAFPRLLRLRLVRRGRESRRHGI